MLNQPETTNYYEILEVAPDAPPHEIHKAYQRAKSTYSSDNPALYSMFNANEARELLRLIEEAYSVLGNPGMRRSYDEARLRGENHPNLLNRPATAAPPIPSHTAPPAHAAAPTPASNLMPPQNVAPPAYPPAGLMQFAHAVQSTQSAQAAHQALPDFADPMLGMSEAMRSEPARSVSALPLGMGRTQLSTYKVDDAFENELKNAADFDGNLLQRTRLYKNISIDRLSEATRISRTYIMALETNDYKSLPAAVFTRGFVVQIARLLGLQDAKVATSYIKMFRAGGGK